MDAFGQPGAGPLPSAFGQPSAAPSAFPSAQAAAEPGFGHAAANGQPATMPAQPLQAGLQVWVQRVQAFYAAYDASKATPQHVQKVLTKYAGHEMTLLSRLFKKYNVPPNSQAQYLQADGAHAGFGPPPPAGFGATDVTTVTPALASSQPAAPVFGAASVPGSHGGAFFAEPDPFPSAEKTSGTPAPLLQPTPPAAAGAGSKSDGSAASPPSHLTPEDEAAFHAPEFELGKVPLVEPPAVLCR